MSLVILVYYRHELTNPEPAIAMLISTRNSRARVPWHTDSIRAWLIEYNQACTSTFLAARCPCSQVKTSNDRSYLSL